VWAASPPAGICWLNDDGGALVALARKAGGVLTNAQLTDAVWKLHDGEDIRRGRDALVLRFSARTSATRTEEFTPSDAS